ncbi:MAG: ChaN family lipoprotein [Desulfobacterales bacterium]|nr:ChaN family lipoprotein [Desulfobacterales bacterium]
MSKSTVVIFIAVLVIGMTFGAGSAHEAYRLHDFNRGMDLTLAEAVADLKKNRIVLVGEHHSKVQHHRAQLAVIRALKEAGVEVAIGLEMFRHESQLELDRWVSGKIDTKSFEKIYYDNWNFPWQAYSMIFEYARENQIPMIGLNVPREITRKVSRDGFKSLTPEQKGQLAEVSCVVDQQYMNYIRQAFGGHGHGQLNFIYFCEAQMVWDTAFAVYSLNYLEKNPNAVVVLLTGVGHAQKGAVPRQIQLRSKLPHTVILPEVAGGIDKQTISSNEADYIILGLQK